MTKRGLDTSIHYDQTNNVIERFLKDLKVSGQTKFWLESCNVEATACAVEAVDGRFLIHPPVYQSKALIGYGDLMFIFLYSNFGQKNAPFVKEGVAENEVLTNLCYLVNTVTTCKGNIITGLTDAVVTSLNKKHAVVLCYKTDYESHHYITLVDYDKDKKEFTAYDSWPDNKHCKNRGILEKYSESFVKSRMRPQFMEVINENK